MKPFALLLPFLVAYSASSPISSTSHPLWPTAQPAATITEATAQPTTEKPSTSTSSWSTASASTTEAPVQTTTEAASTFTTASASTTAAPVQYSSSTSDQFWPTAPTAATAATTEGTVQTTTEAASTTASASTTQGPIQADTNSSSTSDQFWPTAPAATTEATTEAQTDSTSTTTQFTTTTTPPTTETPVQQTTIEVIVETVTRTVIHNVTQPSVDESARGYTPGTPPPGFGEGITVSGKIRQCNCDEASECKQNATASLKTCMESCTATLSDFGAGDNYLDCFTANTQGVLEAEQCLFADFSKTCAKTDADGKELDIRDLSKYKDFDFKSEPHERIRKEEWLRKAHRHYSNFQHFFHCTKHCMHDRMYECIGSKKCTLQLPGARTFENMMVDCTRKNPKISLSLLKTCQCLAYQKKVNNLVGQCAILSNQLFVDFV